MPTNIRYQIVGTTTLAAVLLYLDRIGIAEIAKLDTFKSEALLPFDTGAFQFALL